MSGSVNKVILVGHLGGDPESRSFQNGGGVVNFRLATSESWKDRTTGERKESTQWHTIVIFNEGLQKVARDQLRKGSQVYIEGKLQTRKWQDQAGHDRYATEVVLQGFQAQMVLLDKKPSDPGRHDYSAHDDGRGSGGDAVPGRSSVFDSDLDDDVPF